MVFDSMLQGVNMNFLNTLLVRLGHHAFPIRRPLLLASACFLFQPHAGDLFLNHCLCHGLLNHPKLRMGKKDGFNNELTKKLHDISTAVIPKTKMSVHESVPEYGEDAYLVAETGFQIQQALFPGRALLKYLCLFSVTMLYSGVLYEFKKWSVVPGALALHLSGSLRDCLESLPAGPVHGESSTTRRKWCGIACSLFKRLLRCCYFHLGPHWKCHRQHFLVQVTKRSQSVHGLWRPCHLLKELTWRLFDRNVPRNNFLISLQILNIDAVLKQEKEH